MEELIRSLGGLYIRFEMINFERVERIRKATPTPELLARIHEQMGEYPTAAQRYEVEYRNGLYQSYKPGVDDTLGDALGINLRHYQILEIGGGPSFIAEHGEVGVCLDITEHPHPRLEKANITFIRGDICEPSSVERGLKALVGKGPTLTVLSFCLDRVPDQTLAIQHFAEFIKRTNGMGLITVCLPAKGFSPGVDGLIYAQGNWVTDGDDPQTDYLCIVEACHQEGLKFTHGGLTSHYGVSADSYEELACYVMVFSPA